MATSDNYHTLLPMYQTAYRELDFGDWAKRVWDAYKKEMDKENEMTIEQKTKKTLSPEHLAKLKEGRRLAREKKQLTSLKEIEVSQSLKPMATPNIEAIAEQSENDDRSAKGYWLGEDGVFYSKDLTEECKKQIPLPSSAITRKEAFEYMLQHYKTGDFSTDYATARMIFDYLSKD